MRHMIRGKGAFGGMITDTKISSPGTLSVAAGSAVPIVFLMKAAPLAFG